jgi:hypothetical protein
VSPRCNPAYIQARSSYRHPLQHNDPQSIITKVLKPAAQAEVWSLGMPPESELTGKTASLLSACYAISAVKKWGSLGAQLTSGIVEDGDVRWRLRVGSVWLWGSPKHGHELSTTDFTPRPKQRSRVAEISKYGAAERSQHSVIELAENDLVPGQLSARPRNAWIYTVPTGVVSLADPRQEDVQRFRLGKQKPL